MSFFVIFLDFVIFCLFLGFCRFFGHFLSLFCHFLSFFCHFFVFFLSFAGTSVIFLSLRQSFSCHLPEPLSFFCPWGSHFFSGAGTSVVWSVIFGQTPRPSSLDSQDRSVTMAGRIPAWRSQSVEIRNRFHVSLDYKPWGTAARRLTGVPKTQRVRECIELAAIAHVGPPGKHPNSVREILQDVYIDISQNPCRMAWTNSQQITKCLTTSSLLYAFHRDSVVLPLEMMIWQGHRGDLALPTSMPQNALKELSGQGICLPCLATIVAAAAACGCFEK